MHEKTNVCIQVAATDIRRNQKEIIIMDPDHFLLLFHFEDHGGKFLVDILVLLPELGAIEVVLDIVEALKVVEQGSQNRFMEVEEVLNRIRVKENRYTSVPL